MLHNFSIFNIFLPIALLKREPRPPGIIGSDFSRQIKQILVIVIHVAYRHDDQIKVPKKVCLGSWFWPDCSIVASTKDKLDFVFSLLLTTTTTVVASLTTLLLGSTFAFCTNNQLMILRLL